MSILSIESFHKEDKTFYVTAVVEDVVQVYAQTMYDPAEYGPALCEASFTIEDDELAEVVVPDNDNDLIEFLEELDVEWKVMDNSDYYL
jgi:hypothetical protein